MKGHKFDWRKKRRSPPLCIFLTALGGPDAQREVRMDRDREYRRSGPYPWYYKRGNKRFMRYHQRRMYGIRRGLV